VEDVAIVSVRQQQLEAFVREEQQYETANQEVAAQVEKTQACPVHRSFLRSLIALPRRDTLAAFISLSSA
jgi:hypothetical protein